MIEAWVHQCKQIRYYRTNCTLLGKKNWEHTLPKKKSASLFPWIGRIRIYNSCLQNSKSVFSVNYPFETLLDLAVIGRNCPQLRLHSKCFFQSKIS